MRLIDADALGIGKAKRDAFLIPEYADGWNSAVEHIENAPTVDIKTEVAREIFAEIEKLLLDGRIGGKYSVRCINPYKYAELKNKYTKEGVGE